MATSDIRVFSSVFEDGASIETEEGRIEAVLTHIPGTEPVFTLVHITPEQEAADEFTELYTCPGNAA